MGCICKNNKIDIINEQKIEYKNDFINETNINEDDNQMKDNDDINDKKLIKEEEIDTTILGYPEIVFNLINQIRQNPKYYAKIIEKEISNIIVEENKLFPKKNKIIYENKVKVALARGEIAFREAIEELKEKLENNIHINIYYKEKVSDPEASVLLMIVDDRNKKDSGKKRKAILNKDYKYIGITSKYINDIFISYFSFSKS